MPPKRLPPPPPESSRRSSTLSLSRLSCQRMLECLPVEWHLRSQYSAAPRAIVDTSGVTAVDEALAFVRDHGVVLVSGKGPAPRLTEFISGEPIKGSWW